MRLRQNAFSDSPFPVQVLCETDSTNDALKRMRAAPHGTVLVTGRQTKGRGRLGRSFSSPEGGVYLSVLLRPNAPADKLLHLTAMAAVAVRRAINDCCGVAPEVKWTNDLVYGGRKLCGILTELVQTDGGLCAIVGIGVNCNTEPAQFPPEVRDIAISLREITGQVVDPNDLARCMVRRLFEMDAALLTEKKAWLTEYAAACVTVGKRVQVISGAERRPAFAEGIDENGALLVRWENGEIAAVSTGEVSVRGMYGYV
ncbi:MAG: biotin--[Oscillospiraceae bacterium]|nr:biotin--[acetyl-CoA-carboxylase] ligase [Oscillospiraceae bacterium]